MFIVFIITGILTGMLVVVNLFDLPEAIKLLKSLHRLGGGIAEPIFRMVLELSFLIALTISFFVLAYMTYKWKNEKIKKADKKEIIMPQGTFYMD